MNEDTYIAKAFRYHDLDTSGTCDFQRFRQAFRMNSSLQSFSAIRQAMALILLNYKTFATEFVSGVRREAGQEEEL